MGGGRVLVRLHYQASVNYAQASGGAHMVVRWSQNAMYWQLTLLINALTSTDIVFSSALTHFHSRLV